LVKIDIYTSSSCPYCVRAKNLLQEKGVQFSELSIDSNPELISESVKRSAGMRTVPQIFIDSFHVGGYDDLAELERVGKLDQLLGLDT